MRQIRFVCRALSRLFSKENFAENGKLGIMPAIRLMLAVLLSAMAGRTYALGNNLSPQAKVTVSSAVDEKHGGPCLVDGIIRIDGKGCWVSKSTETFWGQIDLPSIKLEWGNEVCTNKVVLYDLPSLKSNIASGVLRFSDGSSVRVVGIPANGAPRVVEFAPRKTKWVEFEATDGEGSNLGLSEMEVYEASETITRPVLLVDPYIETTRGRYFFSVTGSQPFGMIGAAPITRNKNQFGGGYNYNSSTVLGFPQIHGWMLSGLELMPISGNVDAGKGETAWQSAFSHDGEIVQPGYHRLYLDRYNAWVEQTAADRASLYRITYTENSDASLLINLGGYLSTTTMTNAHAGKTGDNQISGYFDTRGRLWGGPDRVRIYFVVETSRPIEKMKGWVDGGSVEAIDKIAASDKIVNRNEGMTYADAASSGLLAQFGMKAGEPLLVRCAVSYTSLENAKNNLRKDCPTWDFDLLRKQSQDEWNDYFSRIEVKGGTPERRVKFYTDLWHVLLGRHKIDDSSGDYPDYTQYDHIEGNACIGAKLRVRHLPMLKSGEAKHHIYNSDAFWLSMWNLNTLWGLAYPEVLDDFAASVVQMSVDGGLLPRGPNAGGYSFIMSGCPATSLITSAYQQGLTHKWSAKVALREMVKNHKPGGMLGHGAEDGLKFYIQNGYCPDRAGFTIQWAFEDYALSQMAASMKQNTIAREFGARSHGWVKSFDSDDTRLVLPRRADGTWLHKNPLDGWGYEEANAWQATFGLSHDLPRLATLMGGNDSLCSKLNYAFEQAAVSDFGAGYGNGYVSYSNQPALSNAHVFGHAGKPWLSQYWVRRVVEQAYGGTTPDLGYGGYDEDQGQMGGVSALMSIGLFAIDGLSSQNPTLDITSPVFDSVTIHLNPSYYKGGEFRIVAHDNSRQNCYIQRMALNGKAHQACRLPHSAFAAGGQLDIWLGAKPDKNLK